MINGKQASAPGPPSRMAPDREGVAPRGALPPHPERLWVSNGFDRLRSRRRDRSACYLVLAALVFWGFFMLGIAMLITQVIGWFS